SSMTPLRLPITHVIVAYSITSISLGPRCRNRAGELAGAHLGHRIGQRADQALRSVHGPSAAAGRRWYRFGHESVTRAGPGLARGRDPCLNEYSSGGILAAPTRTGTMNRSSPAGLQVQDVTVRFGGVTALDTVSLTA